MTDPAAAWHAEHRYFQKLLALLLERVRKLADGDEPDYELMLDIVSYLHDYADEMHHPREDIAFAALAKHAPELRDTLDALRQEHRVIARAGEILFNLLTAALKGTVVARADIEMAAATYLVYYGNHIAREEEEVLAKAAAVLTAEDWASVRNGVPSHPDPVFGASPDQRYRELRRRIALEA